MESLPYMCLTAYKSWHLTTKMSTPPFLEVLGPKSASPQIKTWEFLQT